MKNLISTSLKSASLVLFLVLLSCNGCKDAGTEVDTTPAITLFTAPFFAFEGDTVKIDLSKETTNAEITSVKIGTVAIPLLSKTSTGFLIFAPLQSSVQRGIIECTVQGSTYRSKDTITILKRGEVFASHMSPTHGYAGDTVTIYGVNFTKDTKVFTNKENEQLRLSISDSSIKVAVPYFIEEKPLEFSIASAKNLPVKSNKMYFFKDTTHCVSISPLKVKEGDSCVIVIRSGSTHGGDYKVKVGSISANPYNFYFDEKKHSMKFYIKPTNSGKVTFETAGVGATRYFGFKDSIEFIPKKDPVVIKPKLVSMPTKLTRNTEVKFVVDSIDSTLYSKQAIEKDNSGIDWRTNAYIYFDVIINGVSYPQSKKLWGTPLLGRAEVSAKQEFSFIVPVSAQSGLVTFRLKGNNTKDNVEFSSPAVVPVDGPFYNYYSVSYELSGFKVVRNVTDNVYPPMGPQIITKGMDTADYKVWDNINSTLINTAEEKVFERKNYSENSTSNSESLSRDTSNVKLFIDNEAKRVSIVLHQNEYSYNSSWGNSRGRGSSSSSSKLYDIKFKKMDFTSDADTIISINLQGAAAVEAIESLSNTWGNDSRDGIMQSAKSTTRSFKSILPDASNAKLTLKVVHHHSP